MTREQRKKLRAIEDELEDVKKKLDSLVKTRFEEVPAIQHI